MMVRFIFQEPRALSQMDFEKVIGTSTKTHVAATEYGRLSSQSSRWPQSDDYQVQAAISELSKLVVSQILNIQSEVQDP